MKILYVIKQNTNRDELLKFGIAGAGDGGTSAYMEGSNSMWICTCMVNRQRKELALIFI